MRISLTIYVAALAAASALCVAGCQRAQITEAAPQPQPAGTYDPPEMATYTQDAAEDQQRAADWIHSKPAKPPRDKPLRTFP